MSFFGARWANLIRRYGEPVGLGYQWIDSNPVTGSPSGLSTEATETGVPVQMRGTTLAFTVRPA